MDPIHLEVLTSPNCPYSPKAIRVAQRVISKHKGMSIYLREVSVATHEGEEMAEAYEIDSTPTFTINGRIAFVGVPAPDTLSDLIKEELDRERFRNSYFF
jgi:glutaredoxin